MEQKVQSAHIPCPHLCTAFPTINIPLHNVTFVTVHEPALALNHPKSIAYIRVHWWWYTFDGFDK